MINATEYDVSSDVYGAEYYRTGCGRPYIREPYWLEFFGSIAQHIITRLQPQTVFDAGCALGFLVEGLRERGVEAYGMDISEYAINNTAPSIRPFCSVGSVAEPWEGRYDLVVSIEVLEHLPQRESERAVANLCRCSDTVLFSSTPFDYHEATHFNVQPPQYWAERFADHGFFHDVDFDTCFLTPWATLYRKMNLTPARAAAMYERKFWLLAQENRGSRETALAKTTELSNAQKYIEKLERKLGYRPRSLTNDPALPTRVVNILRKGVRSLSRMTSNGRSGS